MSKIPALVIVLLSCSLALAAPRPNIILAMADDMGWGDPGYNSMTVTYADGSAHPDQGWISTPTMDAMATNGLRFDRFYSASAVCSPTRASCLTGRNPYRVGVPGANSGRLGFDETPLSEVLSDVGYECGHFGKWHLGSMTTLRSDSNRGGNASVYSGPWHHSYDFCFATESKVPTYHPYRKTNNALSLPTSFSDPNFYGTRYWKMPATWNETSGEGEAVPVGEVNDLLDGDDSKLMVDQAIPFIQDAVAAGKPFFVVLWFHTPHKPTVDPDGVTGTDSNDSLRDSIEDLDTALGRVRDELTTLGVRGNTMFWVTSDNGPENGQDSFNETSTVRSIRSGRFLERKRSLHEGGVRVPGILEWPDVITSGMTSDFPAITTDYYPTILDYLCLSVPDQKPLDGVSLRPVIDGTATTRAKPIGFKYNGDNSWMSHQYKLINDGSGWELYDLLNIAPGEEVEQTATATAANVGTKSPVIQNVYNTMLAEYTAWDATLGTDIPYVHPTQPTVTLSTPSNTVSAPFTVTATFSEAVTQLTAGEFAITNGTTSGLAGGGTTWTVTVSPSNNGAVTVDLPEGCAIDTDGNLNAASNQLNLTYSNPSAPDVGLTTPADPVSSNFVVTATFTEDVTGLTDSDFDVTNGTASGLAGGPAIYTVTVTPTSAGTVSIFLPGGSAEDGSANGNNASNTLNVTYSPPTPPSASLSGPSDVSAAYSVNINFSQPVIGLTDSDFTVSNGSASNLSGGSAAYTALITPSTSGNVTVTLPAGTVTDLNDSLGNTASNSLITTYTNPGGSSGSTIDTEFSATAGQTVDSLNNVPGDQSNNILKFTSGNPNDGVPNPYTSSHYARGSSSDALRRVRAFTRFDLSALTGHPVSTATLSFNGHSLNDQEAVDLQAVALASDWSTLGAPFPTYNHATVGSTLDGGSLIAGLDPGDHTRDYNIDVTTAVRNWLDGTWSNHGLRIQLSNDTTNNGVGIQPSGSGAFALLVQEAPLEILSLVQGPGADDVTIEWNSAPDAVYRIEWNDDLQGTWTEGPQLTGSAGTSTSHTHLGTLSSSDTRFYRIAFLSY